MCVHICLCVCVCECHRDMPALDDEASIKRYSVLQCVAEWCSVLQCVAMGVRGLYSTVFPGRKIL